jgi:hypothetical protein
MYRQARSSANAREGKRTDNLKVSSLNSKYFGHKGHVCPASKNIRHDKHDWDKLATF